MMINTCLTLVACLILVACGATAVTPEATAVPADAQIIDVRTAAEFADWHAPGAINLPYDTIGSQIAEAVPDTDRHLVVYCRSGRRSAIAATTLREAGYQQVTDLGGLDGIKAWLASRPAP